ncbi:MAG: helix-turn-helix domain-containing protein [Bacteroidota bacterium]
MDNLTSKNDRFLRRVHQDIDDNLSNENYSVECLAKNTGLSRSMLHRKLKQLTGKSAGDLITEKRLEKACQLLSNQVGTVSEIAYQVGFNSPSYFNRVFKKKYQVDKKLLWNEYVLNYVPEFFF